MFLFCRVPSQKSLFPSQEISPLLPISPQSAQAQPFPVHPHLPLPPTADIYRAYFRPPYYLFVPCPTRYSNKKKNSFQRDRRETPGYFVRPFDTPSRSLQCSQIWGAARGESFDLVQLVQADHPFRPQSPFLSCFIFVKIFIFFLPLSWRSSDFSDLFRRTFIHDVAAVASG